MPAPAPVPEELTVVGRIGTGLGRLIRLVERAPLGLGDGLDRPSFMLLYTLVQAGPARVTTLAAAVHSDPSTVSRQVAALVGMGLVERRADPADGRASLVAATEAGTALLERARQCRDDRIAAITGPWRPAEREQFAELLDRFADSYEQSGPAR